MSILVKGIEKPKDCGVCPFKLDGWPDEWEMHCKLLGRQVGYFDKKSKVPKDCPIVEVPTPHGRLIDADELTDQLIIIPIDLGYREIEDMEKIVTNAPTIIEAEEKDHAED